MDSILIIDDDPAIARIITRYMEQAGFAADTALNGAAAGRAVLDQAYDLLILDVLLPDTTGLEFCRQLRSGSRQPAAGPARQTAPDVPVLMLSALGLTDDIVDGLRSGADDYLVKPFEPRELVERVRTLLRRRLAGPAADLEGPAGLSADRTSGLAACKGRPLDLTRREFTLLVFLLEHANQLFSRNQLLDAVWGWDYQGGDRAVDLCVLRLRGKLDEAGGDASVIETVRGAGYRLNGRPARP